MIERVRSEDEHSALIKNCHIGLAQLRNLKYPGFIFIGWHEGKRYTFEEGQTVVKAKGQEERLIDPNEIPLGNFPDYAPDNPLLPALASIILDAQNKILLDNPK